MLISIDAADARPIYVQIMDEIRRAVVLGTVKPDDLLPSVRQLAGDLKVNPNTVQQAYRELERAGLVYVRRGQGTFVAEEGAVQTEKERRGLARMVAHRALREAYRNGLSANDLMEAIEQAASNSASEGSTR